MHNIYNLGEQQHLRSHKNISIRMRSWLRRGHCNTLILFQHFCCRCTAGLGIIIMLHDPISVKLQSLDQQVLQQKPVGCSEPSTRLIMVSYKVPPLKSPEGKKRLIWEFQSQSKQHSQIFCWKCHKVLKRRTTMLDSWFEDFVLIYCFSPIVVLCIMVHSDIEVLRFVQTWLYKPKLCF